MAKIELRDAQLRGGVIQRRTLHDEVVDRMRDMIIEGELRAGQRINETELCGHLGVSRTPVREAIKTLASEGLIAAVRNKGAIVNHLGADEIIQLLEAAAMIEQHAAIVGVIRGTDDEIAEICALHNEMRILFDARDRLPYYKRNQAIHTSIVALAHNEALNSMHEGLQMRLRRIRYVGNEKPTSWSGAMHEHELMITALKARDGNALSDAIGKHFEKTNERIIEHLRETSEEF